MITVKSICEKCGFAKEYTKREKIKLFIFKTIQNFVFYLGILFIIYISIVGITRPMNDISNFYFLSSAKSVETDLRHLTINITRDCGGSNSFCHAKLLYENMSDFTYVLSSLNDYDGMYNPLEIYQTKSGDCKNFAMTYIAMLRTIGIDGYTDCNAKKNHCIAVVPFIESGQYKRAKAVIDLTAPIVVILDDFQDVWDYMEIYKNGTNDYLEYLWD